MKERPILFSAPMVRAILTSTKSQTRRVLKPQPDAGPNGKMVDLGGGAFGLLDGVLSGEWPCPYGVPGDLLWVRETHSVSHGSSSFGGDYHSSCEITYRAGGLKLLEYEGSLDADPYLSAFERQRGDWRPSIFMPRWASRLTLEVTGVCVQRLQDITEADAIAEGMPADGVIRVPPVAIYEDLWDELNAKRGFGWDLNPWVWVIEFRRVTA